MFTAFKHIHMTMAILSMVFLLVRFAMGMRRPQQLNQRWAKVLPHVVDALLIVSIIGMLSSVSVSLFPAGFITEKAVMFILYIVFSVLCVLSLRGRMSSKLRVPTFALAVFSWLWLIHVAFSKSPLLFG
ncbi:MAG: SirB2 family protein [Idiomarina sp.]|nr:SirB2 family protein [Idiomarina sp.]